VRFVAHPNLNRQVWEFELRIGLLEHAFRFGIVPPGIPTRTISPRGTAVSAPAAAMSCVPRTIERPSLPQPVRDMKSLSFVPASWSLPGPVDGTSGAIPASEISSADEWPTSRSSLTSSSVSSIGFCRSTVHRPSAFAASGTVTTY
jgi:hypothetical protein